MGAVPDDVVDLMRRYDAHNLHCAEGTLTPDTVNQVISAGYGLYCYTVNDPDNARKLLSWGVHGVLQITRRIYYLCSRLELHTGND